MRKSIPTYAAIPFIVLGVGMYLWIGGQPNNSTGTIQGESTTAPSQANVQATEPTGDMANESNANTATVESARVPNKMVELYTPHCPSCREMTPLINRIIAQCTHSNMFIETFDVSKSENEHLLDRYNVAAVPTFLFLNQEGEETSRLVGLQTENTLKQAISLLKGEDCPGMTLLNKNTNGHS